MHEARDVKPYGGHVHQRRQLKRREGSLVAFVAFGNAFPKKGLLFPDREKNDKEQLAKVVAGNLLWGMPSLGKLSFKMRPVCRVGENKGVHHQCKEDPKQK